MSVGMFLLLIFVGGLTIGAAVVIAKAIQDAPKRNDRRRLREYELFVDRLREIAYDHRELDSTLANIITDEIRTFERKKREIT